MWVTKLLIFPVEIRIFCPKTTKFGPKLAFLVDLGQAMQAYSMHCCGSVGGFGARAVSRKTPIYFIVVTKMCSFLLQQCQWVDLELTPQFSEQIFSEHGSLYHWVELQLHCISVCAFICTVPQFVGSIWANKRRLQHSIWGRSRLQSRTVK